MGRPSRRTLLLVIAVAVLHGFAYIAFWGAAFARFDAAPREPLPTALTLPVSALGFPMMWLPERWMVALRPFFRDDTNTLFLLAGVNALLWGSGVVAIWNRVRSAGRTLPVTTA